MTEFKFGLCITSHGTTTARDKYQTRMALERAGLNTAIAVAIWSEEDCEKAANKVGFPMIIKPTSGGGSQGMSASATQRMGM